MPDKLLDQNGRVHERNIVGDWVPTQRNGLWPEKDVGLLGPNVERGWDGQPKAARTWSGSHQRSRSGTPLFMPRAPNVGGGSSLEAVITQFAILVIWVMIALAILAIWIGWRFLQSLGQDISERRLTAGTVLWGIPVAAMLIGLLVAAVAPHATSSVSSFRGPSSQTSAAERLMAMVPPALAGTCVAMSEEAAADVGATAAVECDPEPGVVERSRVYLFASTAALQAWWKEKLDFRSATLKRGSDCAAPDGRRVTRAPGAFACYANDGHGHVRWTDPDRRLYGTLDMAGRRAAPAAVGWWLDHLAG